MPAAFLISSDGRNEVSQERLIFKKLELMSGRKYYVKCIESDE